MTNTSIKKDIQKLNPGSELVTLFAIDATSLGASIYYFTDNTIDHSPVYFNNIPFIPLPCKITGLEKVGDGTLPRPKLSVSNVGLTFSALINEYNDGVGAKVTITKTFRKYLDDAPTADPAAMYPGDVFFIEQKLSQNKLYIQWELVSPLDIGEIKLPVNQVLSYCSYKYRIYTGGSFNYTNATCPYTGTNYFDKTGVATTIDKDVCGKRLSDCELRYPGASAVLPFKGFPLIGEIGASYR